MLQLGDTAQSKGTDTQVEKIIQVDTLDVVGDRGLNGWTDKQCIRD